MSAVNDDDAVTTKAEGGHFFNRALREVREAERHAD